MWSSEPAISSQGPRVAFPTLTLVAELGLDVQSGELFWVREAHQGTIEVLKRSPDGTGLASCSDDGAIMIWDLHTGEHLQTLRRDRPYERLNITGVRGLTYAQKATLRALGAIEEVKNGE